MGGEGTTPCVTAREDKATRGAEQVPPPSRSREALTAPGLGCTCRDSPKKQPQNPLTPLPQSPAPPPSPAGPRLPPPRSPRRAPALPPRSPHGLTLVPADTGPGRSGRSGPEPPGSPSRFPRPGRGRSPLLTPVSALRVRPPTRPAAAVPPARSLAHRLGAAATAGPACC